jgi:hypothetical protein
MSDTNQKKSIDLASRVGSIDQDAMGIETFPTEPWEWSDPNVTDNPTLTLKTPWNLDVEESLTTGTFSVGTHAVSEANYTITDDDGYCLIAVTTGASDRTVTLPTAADNNGRLLVVMKVDSGAGKVTIDGEGSETINGNTSVYLREQYETITLISETDEWFSLDEGSHIDDVANTERVTTEYIFTADNELDYTSDIADSTTVTISELPSNTVEILVQARADSTSAGSGNAGIRFKRNSSDTDTYFFYIKVDSGTASDVINAQVAIIPTDGNSFYVDNVWTSTDEFRILGYKTKG